jgi:hypothetical protein
MDWSRSQRVGRRWETRLLIFQKLEIKVGNHPAFIQIGDDVLLSRGETTETDIFDKSTLNRSVNDVGKLDQEVDKSQVAMNVLNPYIGKVISMWEEEAVGKDCSSIVRFKDARRHRMKVLVQWYYNVSRKHFPVQFHFTLPRNSPYVDPKEIGCTSFER